MRELVIEHVNSIGALDLVLLLRSGQQDWWSIDDVSRRLRCPLRWATIHLERMCDSGLLDADDGRYAFAPRDPRLHATVDELARAYAEHKRDVLALILSVPGV